MAWSSLMNFADSHNKYSKNQRLCFDVNPPLLKLTKTNPHVDILVSNALHLHYCFKLLLAPENALLCCRKWTRPTTFCFYGIPHKVKQKNQSDSFRSSVYKSLKHLSLSAVWEKWINNTQHMRVRESFVSPWSVKWVNTFSLCSLFKKLFDYSTVIYGAWLPSSRKRNCLPFLLK